jgi:hypothetical protein
MTRSQHRVEHEFVEFIPQDLSPDTIYISTTYATCSHLCLCGCGNKVVTPLAPTEWRLTFDGEHISLHPSIGNWSFDCQSHYWIENSRVLWARAWTKEKIKANRARDRHNKQRYYDRFEDEASDVGHPAEQTAPEPGLRRRLLRRLRPQRRP